MTKTGLLTLLLLGFWSGLLAQRKPTIAVDAKILATPDSLTSSVEKLAGYFGSSFKTEEDRLSAAFVWIAHNIEYNLGDMFNFQDATPNTDQTLRTRRGVCQDYAELFSELANKMGIKTYVINGYTKQYNTVSYNPHAWCASKIGGDWFVFDPTWGSGGIQNGGYVKQLDARYFKMKPEQATKTHMPFDPLWQFLPYPVSNPAFCSGGKGSGAVGVFFHFSDSLEQFEKQTHIDRMVSQKRRIEANVINSYLVYSIVRQLGQVIENYYHDQAKLKYDSAAYFYNEAIHGLNRFIDFRNKQFQPDEGDAYLTKMLDDVDRCFASSLSFLQAVDGARGIEKGAIDYLRKLIGEGAVTLGEQKEFLNRVLATPPKLRRALFYEKM